MLKVKASFSVLLVALLSACGKQRVDGRWYTQAQIERGATVFDDNCASCRFFDYAFRRQRVRKNLEFLRHLR